MALWRPLVREPEPSVQLRPVPSEDVLEAPKRAAALEGDHQELRQPLVGDRDGSPCRYRARASPEESPGCAAQLVWLEFGLYPDVTGLEVKPSSLVGVVAVEDLNQDVEVDRTGVKSSLGGCVCKSRP